MQRLDVIRRLADQISVDVRDCEPGSLLFSSDRFAGQVLLLLSGSVRLIDQARTFGSYTLRKLDAPCLLGISQLLPMPSLEEVRALTCCQFQLINLDQLTPDQSQIIHDHLVGQIADIEAAFIFETLKQDQSGTDHSSTNLQDFKRTCQLISRDQLESGQFIVYLDRAFDGFAYGQILTSQICQTFFRAKTWPRLASVRLTNSSTALADNASPPQSPAPSALDPVAIERSSLPLLPELRLDAVSAPSDEFRVVRATSQRDAFAACLTMLVQFYRLPTRRDTINRAADILAACEPVQADRKQPLKPHPWTARCIAILDELGLAVRSVRVRSDKPCRIPTPAVWIDPQGNALLIVTARSNSLVLIDPWSGREQISEDEARRRFDVQPELISVEVGLHTPRQRFGLKWILPYIKRYRLQLIEVFSASFLNQFFALATRSSFNRLSIG